MNKGDLARSKASGEIGIVLALDVTADNRMFVFMGDGLAMVEPAANWEVVPFSPATSMPANFSELVEAYERERSQIRYMLKEKR